MGRQPFWAKSPLPAELQKMQDKLVKEKEKSKTLKESVDAEKEKAAKAKQYKHMTFYEAAEIARDAEVSEMWLTHFSPSLVHAEEYMGEVRSIFPAAKLGKDGKTMELDFK